MSCSHEQLTGCEKQGRTQVVDIRNNRNMSSPQTTLSRCTFYESPDHLARCEAMYCLHCWCQHPAVIPTWSQSVSRAQSKLVDLFDLTQQPLASSSSVAAHINFTHHSRLLVCSCHCIFPLVLSIDECLEPRTI